MLWTDFRCRGENLAVATKELALIPAIAISDAILEETVNKVLGKYNELGAYDQVAKRFHFC